MILALAGTPCARADDLVLVPVAEPVPYQIKDVEPDVRGIAPGQSEGAVRATLGTLYPGGRQEVVKASVTYVNEGRMFRSPPLLAQIAVRQQSAAVADEMTVYFGLPTSQAPVLGIARRMDFAHGATAPQMAQVTAQVIEKYGPPAVRRPGVGPGGLTLIWLFGDGKARACGGKRPPCPYVSAAVAIARLDAYRAAVADGFELMIQVDLIGQMPDPSRVKSFKTTLVDNRGAVLSYEAAQIQIIAAVENRTTPSATGAGDSPRP